MHAEPYVVPSLVGSPVEWYRTRWVRTPSASRAVPLPSFTLVMCTPWWSHIPPLKRQHLNEYWLFYAAMDGRPKCVEYYLMKDGMNPYNLSSSGTFTLMDFALWGEQRGKEGASAVVVFLRNQWPHLPYKTLETCKCVPWLSHIPSRAHRDRSDYALFQAALQGCLECVHCILTDGGLVVYNHSLSKKHAVLDFAKYAVEHPIAGASDVVSYLSREMQRSIREGRATSSEEESPCSSTGTSSSLSPEWWEI